MWRSLRAEENPGQRGGIKLLDLGTGSVGRRCRFVERVTEIHEALK